VVFDVASDVLRRVPREGAIQVSAEASRARTYARLKRHFAVNPGWGVPIGVAGHFALILTHVL
jgi:hypothetical protein